MRHFNTRDLHRGLFTRIDIGALNLKLKDGRQVQIRSPRGDEAQICLEAIIEIAANSPYILSTPESFQKQTVENQTKWIEDSAESDSAIVLAAYFEGQMIGLCDGRSYKDIKRKHRAALGISLHPDFRSGGLGRKLTEVLLENMKKFAGIKIIELDVMSTNSSAIRLYESLGFKKAGVFPKAYVLPSREVLDNISMYIEL
jgi:putative acetyltransferase